MLDVLKQKFNSAGEIICLQADEYSLPLDSDSVDYVMANMFLHHVENPGQAITEMTRILKPGGKLVIADLDWHDFEFSRKEQFDVWLGFERSDINKWFTEAKLSNVKIEDLNEQCRCDSCESCSSSAINIFIASAENIEIAAFNEFSNFITDEKIQQDYDHIIFDTAPTGHALRMLQLPSAWSSFISESTLGASCLGQLSGLESKKTIYKQAVETLADGRLTTLILVARPEVAPFKEAERASGELSALGVNNQMLIIKGMLWNIQILCLRAFTKSSSLRFLPCRIA